MKYDKPKYCKTQNYKMKHWAELLLIMTAIIWGTGFIATEYAIDAKMSASFIMTIRFVVASLILLLISMKELKKLNKKLLLHGSVAGTILFLAFYAQTVGQTYINVSNSAFLTATNVVMIPFIVWFISKKRPNLKIFALAFTTLIGIGILTIKPKIGINLNIGDFLTILCAFIFALHISYLGLFTKNLNAKLLTLVQLSVAGILSLFVLLVFDLSSVSIESLKEGLFPSLYLGLFATCLCFFMQTKAQQNVVPGKVGIILCTESLFGSIFSIALGLEPLTTSILIGGIIILTSVVMMETNLSFHKRGR